MTSYLPPQLAGESLHQTSHSSPSLNRQIKPLPLQHLGIINPKEITIQHRLHQARDPRDRVHITLGPVPVDPVRDVQRAVQPQREQIVRRDRFGLAGPLQHEELGQDGDGFEPDAEGPEDLF